MDCIAKRLGQGLALVIEIALARDVIEIEGIGIRLVLERRAVSDHDIVAACA